MKKLIILQIIFIFLSACEKATLSSASGSINLPVVEAYLIAGRTPVVKITYQLALGSSNKILQPIQNLDVFIESDGTNHPLLYSSNDSLYHADAAFQVESGKVYRLHFEYDGATISAETNVPKKPIAFELSGSSIAIQPIGDPTSGGGFPSFPDPIEITWENTDGAYYLIVVENIESNPESIFENSEDDPRPTFRSEPEQTSTYELGFQSFTYYGTHRVILYRLNAEYAPLYDDNRNSSQNLSTPYTNVLGGLGIFTGLNADTLSIEVTK